MKRWEGFLTRVSPEQTAESISVPQEWGFIYAKKLCTKLGIRIYAESVYGQGTTIFLEFPVSSYLTKL